MDPRPGSGGAAMPDARHLDPDLKRRLLRGIDLLAGLPDPGLAEVVRLSEVSILRRGEKVYGAGQASDRVYLLGSGSVKLTRESEDGKAVGVALLGPGDIFGELSLSDEPLRQETAEVVEDAVVCGLERDGLRHLLARQPGLALELTRCIGQRLRRVEGTVQDILFKDVRTRLAHALARLADRFGADSDAGVRLGVRLTQTDLAQLIGSTRETTSTIFNEFRRGGLVDTDDAVIVVLDAERLASYPD